MFFFQDAGGGSLIWTLLLPFVFIFGIFYFLVILPQKKQKQQLQDMITQLKINDEVVTNGGVIGKIKEVRGHELHYSERRKIVSRGRQKRRGRQESRIGLSRGPLGRPTSDPTAATLHYLMKNTGLWIRTAIIIAITLVGVYLVFGPRHAPTRHDLTWQGIKDNLAENINLGLDLKGGSHLVMRVKTEEYLKRLTENNEAAAVQAAKDAKDEAGNPLPVTDSSTVAENGNYQSSLNVSDPSKDAGRHRCRQEKSRFRELDRIHKRQHDHLVTADTGAGHVEGPGDRPGIEDHRQPHQRFWRKGTDAAAAGSKPIPARSCSRCRASKIRNVSKS